MQIEDRGSVLQQMGAFSKVENPMVRGNAADPPREEAKKYRLTRAILDRVKEIEYHQPPKRTFEREIGEYILRNKLGGCPVHEDAILVPMNLPVDSRVRALKAGTQGAGQELVFTEQQEFIQLQRNAMRVRSLGARVISGLVGPIAFPKQTAAGTLIWTGEAPGSDVQDSDLGFSQVTLSPKSAQSSTSYSRQLLAQSSLDIEMIVREDLAIINAIGIDLACIRGSGAGNQPRGILNTPGIGSVLAGNGTDGGNPDYSTFAKLEATLLQNNVNMKSPGYLTTPGLRGYLKLRPIVSNFPSFVWPSNDQPYGYNSTFSNQVPSNLTKGSSIGNCHALIFGDWADLIIGEWGVLELIVDPYRLKKQGLIEVTSFVMVDVGVRYPVSFAAALDCLAT